MALKKDSKPLGSEQEKPQNEDYSLLEFKNVENKKSKKSSSEWGLMNMALI